MSTLLFWELYVLHWIYDLNFQLSTPLNFLLMVPLPTSPPFYIFHSSFLSFKNVRLTKNVFQHENVLCKILALLIIHSSLLSRFLLSDSFHFWVYTAGCVILILGAE